MLESAWPFGGHITGPVGGLIGENMKLIRFYLVLLAIFPVGRWGLSLGGAPYDKTTGFF